MAALRNTLNDPDTSPHVRLFLLKVILNCETEFRPYASFWLPVLLFNTTKVCLRNGITYFLCDMVSHLEKELDFVYSITTFLCRLSENVYIA